MVMACVLPGEPAAKRWAIFDSIPALERLIRSRGMDAPTLVGAFYDALDPFRREDRTRDLEDTRGVRLNRDFSPTCYYYAQVLWASWWRGGAAATLRLAQRLRVWHLLAATVLLTALAGAVSRLRRRPRRLIAPYAVLVAGAGGMTLEVVLLLGLQSLYGYVYGVIGYVVGMLMLGLAVGAWSAQRHVTEANARRALGSSQLGLVAAGGLSLAGLLGLQAALQAAPMGGLLPIAAISALMAATGVAVGAAFPSALALVGERQRGIAPATALYATDLVGACGGAILAGLVLVPLLGVVATCAAVMMLAAGAALLAFTAPGHRR
jgi:spermidine synthase